MLIQPFFKQYNMACTSDITSGRERVCKNSLGGLEELYIYNDLEDSFTVVDGVATAINPLLTEVFKFEIEGNGQTLTENFVSERENGTSLNTQTTVAILKKQDAVSSFALSKLIKGYPRAVVKDRNGIYHAVGLRYGIDFSIDATTGGAMTDLNGYTLTGVSYESDYSPKLDSATVIDFLALEA